jgi:hypothetical protein
VTIDRHRRLAARLALVLLAAVATVAPARPTDESEVQAAYIVNFVRYARWPSLPASAPVAVAVVGGAEMAAPLRALARRIGSVDGHPLVVRVLPLNSTAPARSAAVTAVRAEMGDAQVLFVAPSHRSWNTAAIAAAAGRPVLTVGTGSDFAAAGGMFSLFNDDGRVRFSANADAVRASGVDVSARVMLLARAQPGSGG